jgi:hypothetical protein
MSEDKRSIEKEFASCVARCKKNKTVVTFPSADYVDKEKRKGVVFNILKDQVLPFAIVGEVLSNVGLTTNFMTFEDRHVMTTIVPGYLYPFLNEDRRIPFKYFFHVDGDCILIPGDYFDVEMGGVNSGISISICDCSIVFHCEKVACEHLSTFTFQNGCIFPLKNSWPAPATPVRIYNPSPHLAMEKNQTMLDYIDMLRELLNALRDDIERVTNLRSSSSATGSHEKYGDLKSISENVEVLSALRQVVTDKQKSLEVTIADLPRVPFTKKVGASIMSFLFKTEFHGGDAPAYKAGDDPVPMSDVPFPWNFQLLGSVIAAFQDRKGMTNVLQFHKDALPRFLNELASRRLYWIPAGPFILGTDGEYLSKIPDAIRLHEV